MIGWGLARRRGRARLIAGAVVVVAALAGGCGHGTPGPVASPGAADRPPFPGAPAAGGPGPPVLAGSPSLARPSGPWLRDAVGREYFMAPLAKRDAVRVDERTVRAAGTAPVEVEGEDAAFYYFRVFRSAAARPAVPAPPSDPTEPSRPVPPGYEVTTPESDRLRWIPFDRGLPRAGQWRDGFAVADLDGDGHPDLVHGPARKSLGPPTIFLGDGRGGWRRWREVVFPALPYDYGDAQVGDLDGDGHPDLVLAVHLHGLLALRGDGHGRFTEWGRGLDFARPGTGASGFSARTVRLVDWDGDGRLDILALGEGPRPGPRSGGVPRAATGGAFGVVVHLNRGDGSWVRRDDPNPSRNFGAGLAVGDFDGDGRRDFAVGSSVLGRRDLVHLADGSGGWRATMVPEIRPRSYVRAVAAGDVDGDGRDDLALAYQSIETGRWWTGIDVLLARPGGAWHRASLWAREGRGPATALAIGDVDGDGRRDVVALLPAGALAVFLGDGRGSFSLEATAPRFTEACRGSDVVLADLDDDGAQEIVASFAEERDALQEPTQGCRSEGGLAAWHLVR